MNSESASAQGSPQKPGRHLSGHLLKRVTSFANKEVTQVRTDTLGGTVDGLSRVNSGGSYGGGGGNTSFAVDELLDDQHQQALHDSKTSESPCRVDSGAASALAEESEFRSTYPGRGEGDTAQMIVLGVCCMEKKLRSQTMTAMLQTFESFHRFIIVPFPQDLILNTPVEQWPRVDAMISFFSSGFPLDKAIAYAQRHPDTYFLTHPASQNVLLDRRDFYSALRRNNVPMIQSIYCNRDGYQGEPIAVVEENVEEEWISVNGARMYKPFVEKPVDSEDHNVYIYYDRSRGGGCRKLFRKKEDQSSAFAPDVQRVRQEGSFVYEQYVETANFMDVKCYTVGPNFVHAEQRKAPCVDGVVLRSATGKEVREDVELTPDERMVARKVIKVFRQMVCGFDILRAKNADGQETFYVCDVNGWSFVKNNSNYVQRATEIMKDIFVEEMRKRGLHRISVHKHHNHHHQSLVNASAFPTPTGGRLRMTPKSSSDSISWAPLGGSSVPNPSLPVLHRIEDGIAVSFGASIISSTSVVDMATSLAISQQHAQLPTIPRELIGVVGVLRHADRTPKQKVKILLSADVILDLVFGEGALNKPSMKEELVFKSGHPVLDRICECAHQLLDEMISSDEVSSLEENEVRGVIRTSSNGHYAPSPTASEGATKTITFRAHNAGDNPTQSIEKQLRLIVDVLGKKREGLKVQIRPSECDNDGKCIEALVICKWGGWLTEAGHKQAEMLGNHFIKRIFGAEPSERCVSRDQLTITTNNERRVIYTGLDFARCLLKDVTLDESHCRVNEPLLGSSLHAKPILESIAAELHSVMHIDCNDAQGMERIATLPGVKAILHCPVLDPKDRSPRGAMRAMHQRMKQLVQHIPEDDSPAVFYRGEPAHLMRLRWQTLTKGFYNAKNDKYDTSKITDVFDYVSYDVCYNQEALAPLDLYPLFTIAEVLSQFVSDGEYGLTPEQKQLTGCLIASPLFETITKDLHQIAKHRSPLTRLYFTSESHVMGLKNLLYHSNEAFHRLDEPQELHFLTHFVFKVYRYVDTGAVQLEVHFSAGMDKNMFGIVQEHHVEYNAVTPMIRIHNDLTLNALDSIHMFHKALFEKHVPYGSLKSPTAGGKGKEDGGGGSPLTVRVDDDISEGKQT